MRDLNAEFQDTLERKYAYEFDHVLRGYMLRTFAPLLPKGRALELGCYKGEFTALLADRYEDLTVVEGSAELIEAAKARVANRASFIHSRFESVSPTGLFDAVFLIHTLEHLDDPVSVLRRIGSWLSPAGLLFVAVPNANAASRQIAVRMGLISHNAAVTDAERLHGHRTTYALDTLQRDIRQSGLNIDASGGVFFKPLANYQFDALMGGEVVSDSYMEGCYLLGTQYPDLCASIYCVCSKQASGEGKRKRRDA